MFVDHDPAFGKRDAKMRRFDLKGEALEGDGIVVSDSTLFFAGENEIKINMRLNWHKGRAGLFGFNGESFVVFTNVNIFEETIGSGFGFNAVQTEFITEPALKSAVDSFAPAASLR